MVGRGDAGGLANLTRGVAFHLSAHLPVFAALVVNLGEAGRGPFDRRAWDLTAEHVRVCDYPPTPDDCDWLLERADVVYTAEVPYAPELPVLAGARKVPLVLHAMPELFKDEYLGPTTRIALPTSWLADQPRFEGAVSLPVPVDTDEFAWSPRSHAGTFLHVAASAFHDRNGTELLKAALPHVQSPVTVHTRGVIPEGRVEETLGNVTLVHFGRAQSAREVYGTEDVLIQPRRFGGLSLTAQEALALGMPIVTLDWDPYAPHAIGTVSSLPDPVHVPMAGGNLPVMDADPRALAQIMDALVESPDLVAAHNVLAWEWAVEHSWDAQRETWMGVLSADA